VLELGGHVVGFKLAQPCLSGSTPCLASFTASAGSRAVEADSVAGGDGLREVRVGQILVEADVAKPRREACRLDWSAARSAIDGARSRRRGQSVHVQAIALAQEGSSRVDPHSPVW